MKQFHHEDPPEFGVGYYITNEDGEYSFEIRSITYCPSIRNYNKIRKPYRKNCASCTNRMTYQSNRSGMWYCSDWGWRIK